MSESFDYTEYKEQPGDNLLAQLSATALDLHKAQREVERLEEELAAAKKEVTRLEMHELPRLMDEAEQLQITTKDGITVKMTEKIRASIPKASQAQAYHWLEENGHEELIKRQFVIEFSRDEQAWAKKFERDMARRVRPLPCTRKETVAPQTLQKFIREQLEEGVDIPLNLFGAFRQRFVKLEVK